MQGPNELDGAASTRSDTLPLGVIADHIISSLPSTLDNSISGLIDWDRRHCHNRFQCSGTPDLRWDYKCFIAQKQSWSSGGTDLLLLLHFFITVLTTRWQGCTIKWKSLHTLLLFFNPCLILHHKVVTVLHKSSQGVFHSVLGKVVLIKNAVCEL